MRMRPFGRLIPVGEALRRLEAVVHPVARTERIALDEALGRVVARPVRARRAVPAFARATWDGYAVRSVDLRKATPRSPVELRLIGEVFAEDPAVRPIRAGETVAVATGAALPRGADSVVIFEETRARPGAIAFHRPAKRGQRVAAPGDDYPVGATVVSLGEVLTPAALGGLGAVGERSVQVRARPIVAIVPNGNELVEPGHRLGRGQIFESNNRTLSAVVRACGGIPAPHPPVPDDPARIERALRAALRTSDLVISTGGSSVGERDYLPSVFPRIGRLLFHGLAVRPGKPTLAAIAGRKLLLGMPGHPTSCLSNGLWLLLPVLRRLSGLPGPGWREGTARLGRAIPPLSEGFTTVVPLRVEGGWAIPTFHDSSAITSLAGANAYALLPPGSIAPAKGSPIAIRVLPPPLSAVV